MVTSPAPTRHWPRMMLSQGQVWAPPDKSALSGVSHHSGQIFTKNWNQEEADQLLQEGDNTLSTINFHIITVLTV